MRVNVFVMMLLLAAMPAKSLQVQTKTAPAVPAAASKLPAVATASKLPHQLIYPGDLFYPKAQAETGLQGETTLEVALSKAGKATRVRVITSSKSTELDNNALAFVNTGYWKLPENGLNYYEGAYSLSVIFIRDSVLTINTKTCAEFNTDLKYFRSIQSSEKTKNFGALELMANISTVQLMKNQGANGALMFVKSIDGINNDTISTCAKKPTALFVKAYSTATKKYGIKF